MRKMRKNIFEIIAEQEYNLTREGRKLNHLLGEGNYELRSSLEAYVDLSLFRSWEYRDTAINVKEYRDRLDIDNDILSRSNISLDIFLKLSEYSLNICLIFDKKSPFDEKTKSRVISPIIVNIKKILEELNHEIIIPDEDKCKVIIIEKNPSATAVAEIIEDNEISRDVIRYNHFMLKGDLAEKKKILSQLYKEFEKIRKKLNANNQKGMAQECGLLFNALEIRHANHVDPDVASRVEKMTDEELEEWYDKTYDLFLTCELVANYIDMGKDIDWLKKGE